MKTANNNTSHFSLFSRIALFTFLFSLLSCSDRFEGKKLPDRQAGGPVDKRGVGYNFTDGNTTEADMDLLTPAVKWFYNWGKLNSAVDTAAADYGLVFYPMEWGGGGNLSSLRNYLDAHPDCEYVLAYNEPNLTDQANMTPVQAAQHWPGLVNLIKEYNAKDNPKYHLKLVSPAMNYGTLANYDNPIKWLDEFFAQPGVSLDDIAAISIHCYMGYASAMKSYIGRFKKYNKPIWMTEFCAWENVNNVDAQMRYMSEAVIYMELDPMVEKYAWFIPKDNHGTIANMPYNKLLTRDNPPALTVLGKVYTNMSTCDMSVFVPAGERIAAAQFTNCNTWISVITEGFTASVHFRPGTDTDNGEELDIYDFDKDKWVEYQVDVPSAKTYTLSLRNTAPSATTIEISVDGGKAATVSLGQSSAWKTTTAGLSLTAGRHIIRLEVKSGNCALNWVKVE